MHCIIHQIFGNREDSQLLTNMSGHHLCIDRFGLCKMTDEPRTCHGEASVTEWNIDRCTNEQITFSVHLPLAKLLIKRAFMFDVDRVYVSTAIRDTRNRFQQFFSSDSDTNYDKWKEEIFNERSKNMGMNDSLSMLTINDAFLFSDAHSSPNTNARKSEKAIRQQRNIQNTYQIIHGSMEEEYKLNVWSDSIKKTLSPMQYLQKFRKKNTSLDENERINVDVGGNEMNDNIIEFEEEMIRRDIEWCEHISISDPFLSNSELSATCDSAFNFPLFMEHSRFANEPLLGVLSVEECLRMPEPEIATDEAIVCRAQNVPCVENVGEWANFVISNKMLKMELEYNWDANIFPWMCVWTENYTREQIPWNKNERVRGLELSTKPFPIPNLEQVLPDLTFCPSTKVQMWNGKSIEYLLKQEGNTETFSFRWSVL